MHIRTESSTYETAGLNPGRDKGEDSADMVSK